MLVDTRTPHPTSHPGEAAYLAYWRAWPVPLALPWRQLTQAERRAWRAVARELARWTLQPPQGAEDAP